MTEKDKKEKEVCDLVKNFIPSSQQTCGNCGYDDCCGIAGKSCGGWIPEGFQNFKEKLRKIL